LLNISYREEKRKGNVFFVNRTEYAVAKYADDFVIMCESEVEANNLYNKLNPYLTARGLELAMEKTKVTHIEDGFDFLGFNIRKYKTHNGSKVLIKPSKNSIKVAKKKITDKTRQFYGKNVQILVSTLNPIIIGTANS
jgi:RNA-directed DNA polymerase